MNLLVPVVGPMLLLALITPVRGFELAKQLIKESVNDGQLFWSSIAISASAIHEAIEAFQDGRGVPLFLGLMISFLVLTTVVASNIVMLATLDKHSRGKTANAHCTGARRNDTAIVVSNVVWTSCWLTLSVVVCSSFLHVSIS